MEINYFDFFEIPISFFPDEKNLKSKFYANNRKFHPDFYTLKSEEEQQYALNQSILNNKAYKTLNNFESKLKYILQHFELIKEGDKGNAMSQDFLMEMMDLNESIMELEFDFDLARYEKATSEIKKLSETELKAATVLMKSFDSKHPDLEILSQLKDFYFKNRYLIRIQKNLDRLKNDNNDLE